MPPPANDTHPPLQTYKYTNLLAASKIIHQQLAHLLSGTTRTQYLLFHPVPPRKLPNLDNSRYDRRHGPHIPKAARFTYDADKEELVVKMMGLPRLECANSMFAAEICIKVYHMGVHSAEDELMDRLVDELVSTGAETYKVGSESREPDSSYQVFERRGPHG
ncbi:hypothetical protein VE03_02594 [Pseudogymnoascus sp. 23342-1-I1]|nr:hypothetical protein VE03_02594 [Pseudogymnoascus sp. 23342-1-I1]